MKRIDIQQLFDDNHQDQLKDVLDHFENEFNQIRDLLADIDIRRLDDIPAAHDIAKNASDNLY